MRWPPGRSKRRDFLNQARCEAANGEGTITARRMVKVNRKDGIVAIGLRRDPRVGKVQGVMLAKLACES